MPESKLKHYQQHHIGRKQHELQNYTKQQEKQSHLFSNKNSCVVYKYYFVFCILYFVFCILYFILYNMNITIVI